MAHWYVLNSSISNNPHLYSFLTADSPLKLALPLFTFFFLHLFHLGSICPSFNPDHHPPYRGSTYQYPTSPLDGYMLAIFPFPAPLPSSPLLIQGLSQEVKTSLLLDPLSSSKILQSITSCLSEKQLAVAACTLAQKACFVKIQEMINYTHGVICFACKS